MIKHFFTQINFAKALTHLKVKLFIKQHNIYIRNQYMHLKINVRI